MMRTWQIAEHRVVEGAILAMAITMLMARVRRTSRAVRNQLGKARERRIERGNGRRSKTGRWRGSQWSNGSGTGKGTETGTGKGKVLLNTPQREKARRVVERLQGSMGMGHQELTRVGMIRAGSITCVVNFRQGWHRLYRGVSLRIWLRTWFWCWYANGEWCGHIVGLWFRWPCGYSCTVACA